MTELVTKTRAEARLRLVYDAQRSHRVQKIYCTVGPESSCENSVALFPHRLHKESGYGNAQLTHLRRWPRCWLPHWRLKWCSANSATCSKTTVHIFREEDLRWITKRQNGDRTFWTTVVGKEIIEKTDGKTVHQLQRWGRKRDCFPIVIVVNPVLLT